MASAASTLQSLLRFLTQEAKVPLSVALSKTPLLQSASLQNPSEIAKAKPATLAPIFEDEKIAKQVLAAAKRVVKKRAAQEDGEEVAPPRKRRKDESLFTVKSEQTPAELEASLALPPSNSTEAELQEVVLFTNRAPLVLAFAVVLLKYTMPEQPLSSRLSLAQTYVSVTSRARAVNLGIEKGASAEAEGFGNGQPIVVIMGKELRVLRRWGYEWQDTKRAAQGTSQAQGEEIGEGAIKIEAEECEGVKPEDALQQDEKPALWGLDLEAFKKSKIEGKGALNTQSATTSNMPIHTPHSARAYLLKSFNSARSSDQAKKPSATVKAAEKERNLGMLLQSIDMLFQSWLGRITPEELDKRIWSWYVQVRPDVDHGVAGWGGKNELKLATILALRNPG